MARPSTVVFLELHSMMWLRNDNRLRRLGYRPWLNALRFITSHNMCKYMISLANSKNVMFDLSIRDDIVEESVDTITGIKITLYREPVRCLRFMMERNFFRTHKDLCILMETLILCDYVESLRYVNEEKCPILNVEASVYDRLICCAARKGGSITCLKYIYSLDNKRFHDATDFANYVNPYDKFTIVSCQVCRLMDFEWINLQLFAM